MPAIVMYEIGLTGHFAIDPVGGGNSSIVMYDLWDSLVVGIHKSLGNGE